MGFRSTKYHSKRVVCDGIVFDSKKEFRRYKELLVLLDEGEISDLRRQVKYVLIPAQREPDRKGPRGGVIRGRLLEREAAYIADFVYKNRFGEDVVEDVKGMRTPEYILKRKMMLYLKGIAVREV